MYIWVSLSLSLFSFIRLLSNLLIKTFLICTFVNSCRRRIIVSSEPLFISSFQVSLCFFSAVIICLSLCVCLSLSLTVSYCAGVLCLTFFSKSMCSIGCVALPRCFPLVVSRCVSVSRSAFLFVSLTECVYPLSVCIGCVTGAW